MLTPTIKPDFKGKVRRNDDLKLTLAKANGVKVSTIDRWIKDDDEMLTTVRNLEILKKHFGILETEELLEGIHAGDAAA